MLPNKHYEIPFDKEYAMGFPLSYSVTNATGCIVKRVIIYRPHSKIIYYAKKEPSKGWFLAMVDDDRIELPTSCL